MLVHLVADYGAGDLAFAEVVQRLHLHLGDAVVVPTPVPPFDTIGAGFLVAQLALGDGPPDRVVFHNVAPRFDDDDPRRDNRGEAVIAGRTAEGVWVIGPNAGHAFSLVAEHLESIHVVDTPAAGSQFRSRDFFPEAIARIARGEALGRELGHDEIPPLDEGVVLYTDGYGNLKTNWVDPPVRSGDRVLVRIGATHHPAVASDGTFEVGQGEMSFAPGSSGWGERRLYELLLRGGSAAQRFRSPAAGERVELIEL